MPTMPSVAPFSSSPSSCVGVQPAHSTGADQGLALERAPGRPEQAQHREVRSGLGQHVGRVADGNAALARRRQVDVLVAGRERRDRAHRVRQALDHRRRPGIGGAGQDRAGARTALDQLVGAIRPIFGIEARRVVAAQPLLDRLRQPAGHQNDGSHELGSAR